MGTLKAAYPNSTVRPETVAVYEQALADLDVKDVGRAVADLVKTSTWFPTISEIRGAIVESKMKAPLPGEAWEEASGRAYNRWAKEGNSYNPYVTKALKQIGGASTISYSDNQSVTRAQFIRAYEDVVKQAKEDYQTGRVPLSEIDEAYEGEHARQIEYLKTHSEEGLMYGDAYQVEQGLIETSGYNSWP